MAKRPQCKICGMSVFDGMLHRTNPVGSDDPGWTCTSCLKKAEPELHNNVMENGGEQIFKSLEEFLTPNKNKKPCQK